MRLVVLALAVAAAPLGGCHPHPRTVGVATAPKVTAVTVVLAPFTVGSRWLESHQLTLEVEARMGTRSAWFGSKRRYRSETEVLAVDAAGLITRAAVTYHQREDEDEDGAAPRPRRSVLAGRSYVVVASGGGRITATRADGHAVSPVELTELTRDQDAIGKQPAMDAILARTWTIGEEVALTADELRRLDDHRRPDAPLPTAMSFTLREVRADELELAMRGRLQGTGGAAMTIDVTGNVVLDRRTGRTKQVRMIGAVTGTAGGALLNGNLRATTTVEPSPAAASLP